ncbi:MAG TPA: type II toxin-antitoxin system VapC family toxin [Gammaproteobacteria bacterium]|nr:type II toxin-antitoxin system VapC family toxin [Gammaproteobacteria bacterium]
MIILDTHTLVWLDMGSALLGSHAIQVIDQALADNALAISAITFWEVAMLARKGRLELEIKPRIWRNELMERGLIELSLDGKMGIQAAGLQSFHGDPADRMIVATALATGSTLVTADKKILDWSELSQKIDARL